MAIHEIKCWPPHWNHVNTGLKVVEIRRDDRPGGYQVGDILRLKESIPEGMSWVGDVDANGLTGRVCDRRITHVLPGGQFGLHDGYVALSLELVSWEEI